MIACMTMCLPSRGAPGAPVPRKDTQERNHSWPTEPNEPTEHVRCDIRCCSSVTSQASGDRRDGGLEGRCTATNLARGGRSLDPASSPGVEGGTGVFLCSRASVVLLGVVSLCAACLSAPLQRDLVFTNTGGVEEELLILETDVCTVIRQGSWRRRPGNWRNTSSGGCPSPASCHYQKQHHAKKWWSHIALTDRQIWRQSGRRTESKHDHRHASQALAHNFPTSDRTVVTHPMSSVTFPHHTIAITTTTLS